MASAAEQFRNAITAFQQGRLDDAERLLRQVLRKEPRHPAALNVSAIVLTAQKKFAEAERQLQAALKVNATSDATFYNYGIVLKALGRPEEALERFTQAIALNPGNAESWNNRAATRNELNDHTGAIVDLDRAIALNPNYPAALVNKGKSFLELGRHHEALTAYDQALAVRSDVAEAWFGRGFVLHQLGRHEAAAHDYAQALRIDPRLPFLKGSLLHQRMLICEWDGIGDLIQEIESDIAAGRLSAEPFSWQGVATAEWSLQRCAELYNQNRFPAQPASAKAARREPIEKIRIGYVSGEFRQQATSLLLVGVLEHHDRDRFEIYAFDNGWNDSSETRHRIDAAVQAVVDIREVNDQRAVEAIHARRIDILVNLNGYFGEQRTRLFARRPAAIQVNYLGFPGTLGASYIDYIIADRHVLPDDHWQFFDEKVAWLPNCYQANDRNKEIATRTPNRAEFGLPAEGFVFCCFNNSYKITPNMFDSWMRILHAVEGSVLWLLEDSTTTAANLRNQAAARGVSPERIFFAPRLPLSEHLARHRCADLFLDTLPYNAHTTASDALWAGLPVVTCTGQTFAGKVATSLLHALRLPELITATVRDYEQLAVRLATHREEHARIRQKLAEHRLTTPLFDTKLFTRHIEAAYTAMVERCAAGKAPDHIIVPD